MYKTNNNKQKYDIQQQMTTTLLQDSDLGQAHTECGEFKHVSGRPTHPQPLNK